MFLKKQIVIDQISLSQVLEFHQAIDQLRDKFNLRIRIKENGKVVTPLKDFPRSYQEHNQDDTFT